MCVLTEVVMVNDLDVIKSNKNPIKGDLVTCFVVPRQAGRLSEGVQIADLVNAAICGSNGSVA